MQNEKEQQPGPSNRKSKLKDSDDVKNNNNTIATNRLSASSNTSKLKKKKIKKTKKRRNENSSRRTSTSIDQPLRYKIQIREKGVQPSNSIRNIVPSQTLPIRRKRKENPSHFQRIIVHQVEETNSDRDHHDAVDFYYRSTAYSHHQESLSHLRKHAVQSQSRKLFIDKSKHQSDTDTSLTSPNKHERCKKCLERHNTNSCVMSDDFSGLLLKTDWLTLVQPSAVPKKKVFTEPRHQWLVDLEESSKVDKRKLLEDSQHGLFCCFPFMKLKFTSKREREYINFYLRN